jgi:DNA-binding transcriptional LysR family regulator
MIEWGDLRYLLAVGRTGSTLAAAKLTGASQSTVARRLTALETALGLKLFERMQDGSRLTAQGEALMQKAQAVEAAFQDFEEAAQQARRRLSGVIRVTTNPEGADPIVTAPLAAFMRQHPDVRIEMLATEDFLDIAAGEADVALRSGPRPEDPNLVARKIQEVAWACYASPAYIADHGAPATPADLASHLIVGPEGRLAQLPAMLWLAERAGRYACHASSMSAMMGLAKAGAGVAVLTELYADTQPDLVRCLAVEVPPTDIWLVTRQDIRKTPHVRALIDFIYGHAALLPGGVAAPKTRP